MNEKRPLSQATIKAQERRKKSLEAEAAKQESNFRPKSAPPVSHYAAYRVPHKDTNMGAVRRNPQNEIRRAVGGNKSQQLQEQRNTVPNSKPIKDNINMINRAVQAKRHSTVTTNNQTMSGRPNIPPQMVRKVS